MRREANVFNATSETPDREKYLIYKKERQQEGE